MMTATRLAPFACGTRRTSVRKENGGTMAKLANLVAVVEVAQRRHEREYRYDANVRKATCARGRHLADLAVRELRPEYALFGECCR